jgi:hypothetical protein
MFNRLGIVAVLSVAALAGCATFSRARAEAAQAKFHCGLSVAEVERIVGGPLEATSRAGTTHFLRDGHTDLTLQFDEGRLKASQIVWVVGIKGIREGPRIEHCKGLA